MRSTLRFVFVALSAVLLVVAGCRPEPAVELGAPADASFTMTPIPGQVNTYLLVSSSTNAYSHMWDKMGTGNFVQGKAVDTAYFPLRGNYTVRLRAFGRGGYDTASQSVVITVDDIFRLLTSKSWKLNPANASIIVGTEANPAEYFPGGALADCQKDDVYTFGANLKLTYNANGATFNAGNIAPNFSCATDRSYNNVDYTFSIGATGAGLATITLPGTVPAQFIGVTDVASNNYRIISISATEMVLRSGTSTQTVHQFKFIAQ